MVVGPSSERRGSGAEGEGVIVGSRVPNAMCALLRFIQPPPEVSAGTPPISLIRDSSLEKLSSSSEVTQLVNGESAFR